MSNRQATKRSKQAPKKASSRSKDYSSNEQRDRPARRPARSLSNIQVALVNEGKGFRNNHEPNIKTNGKTTVITHRELVGPLIAPTGSSTAFTQLMRLRCNPGSSNTFPWLSKMAPLYENFRFRRLSFQFYTRCATSQVGSLIMSPDYDAADGQQTITEQVLFSNINTVDEAIYKKVIVLDLSPQRLNRLYKSHVNMSDTRFESSTQDEKTIDPAQVFVFTDSPAAAGFAYGKLVVDYQVELHEPQAPTDPPQQGGFALRTTTNLLSGTPIGTVANTIVQQETSPIIEIGPLGAVYPGNVAGKFLRDWEGTLTTQFGIASGNPTNAGSVYISNNVNNGVAGDTVQSEDPTFRAGVATGSFTTSTLHNVVAKAGQYLKLVGPTSVINLSSTNLAAGGVGFPVSI